MSKHKLANRFGERLDASPYSVVSPTLLYCGFNATVLPIQRSALEKRLNYILGTSS